MSFITVPFSWVLRALYEFFGNYGIAIIIFALIVKLIMLPFMMKSKRSMMRMTRLNPQVEELKKRHAANQQKMNDSINKLYRDEKVNPMSGCLWSLIPWPIMIALYDVVRKPLSSLMGLTEIQISLIGEKLISMGAMDEAVNIAQSELMMAELMQTHYDAVSDLIPGVANIDFSFLGMNLGSTPQLTFFMNTDWSSPAVWLPALGLFLLPILSVVFTYIQMKISQKTNPQDAQAQGSMKGMMMMMPLLSLWIGFSFPAALSLYWLIGNIWTIFQDIILNKHYTKVLDAEESDRRETRLLKEQEIEMKRQETERLKLEGATTRNPSTSKRRLQAENKARQDEYRAEQNQKRREELGIVPPESQVGKRRYARGRAYTSERYAPLDDSVPTPIVLEHDEDYESDLYDDLLNDPDTNESEAADGGSEDATE